eukprot:scaffold373590_cov15-Prasinocladus_malaysianus.AAC.1
MALAATLILTQPWQPPISINTAIYIRTLAVAQQHRNRYVVCDFIFSMRDKRINDALASV